MIPPAERIADSDIITRCRQTAGAELSKQMTVKMKDFIEEIAMNIKIIVATHKKYWMPSDPVYFPIHVGAEGKKDPMGHPLDLGYIKDNTGENISDKNKNYCELTGLYWAWKNLNADYIGLAHYRRHFTVKNKKGTKEERVITGAELEGLLSSCDVLPEKLLHRNQLQPIRSRPQQGGSRYNERDHFGDVSRIPGGV